MFAACVVGAAALEHGDSYLEQFMRKLTNTMALLSVLGTASAALAQDTTDNGLLGTLAGIGIGGLVILAVLVFVLFRFFFNGGD